jgi:hypothetical protein
MSVCRARVCRVCVSWARIYLEMISVVE